MSLFVEKIKDAILLYIYRNSINGTVSVTLLKKNNNEYYIVDDFKTYLLEKKIFINHSGLLDTNQFDTNIIQSVITDLCLTGYLIDRVDLKNERRCFLSPLGISWVETYKSFYEIKQNKRIGFTAGIWVMVFFIIIIYLIF